MCLDSSLLGLCLLELVDPGSGLGATAGAAPVLLDFVSALVVVDLDGLDQLVEGAVVLLVDLDDGHAGGGLPVDSAAETSLVLDDAVGHAHLSAQGGQEQNNLNGLDIAGDGDELGSLLLNQSGDGVDAVTDNVGPLGLLLLGTALGLSLSLGPQPLGLLGLGLWTVLVKELEQVGGCLLVEGLRELVDWWGDLQTGLEDGLLPLETDVLGPLDKVSQVTLGLDVLTNAEGPWPLLEEWVGDALDLWLLDSQGGGRDLLSLLVLLVDHCDWYSGDNLG